MSHRSVWLVRFEHKDNHSVSWLEKDYPYQFTTDKVWANEFQSLIGATKAACEILATLPDAKNWTVTYVKI